MAERRRRCRELQHRYYADVPSREEVFDATVMGMVKAFGRAGRQVFSEFSRVLRRGGRVVFTTPNKYYYGCLIALLTPEALKAAYFRRVFGEDAYDHFPVRYRANTRRALRALARISGLAVAQLTALPHYPFYLMFSPTLFRLGVLYDTIISRLGLDSLQSTWLVVMEKP